MIVLETERVILRWLTAVDADFILNLLNQPSFIQYIGDRGVKNLSDARLYIESKFIESYRRFGFGLYLVELKQDKTPIGICGFVKRDTLPDADIGFAFLPQYWSQGYAFESARAALDYGKSILGFRRILAITTKDNDSSGKLLAKVGLKYERMIRLSDEEDESKLFSSNA
ncbi:MAG: GNAT family N-acetyltransferase [Pyrinomonadaceae bacterium]